MFTSGEYVNDYYSDLYTVRHSFSQNIHNGAIFWQIWKEIRFYITALTLSKDGAAFVWIAAYLGGGIDCSPKVETADAQCPFWVGVVQILWGVFAF